MARVRPYKYPTQLRYFHVKVYRLDMATMAILFHNKRVVGFILSFYVFVLCFLPTVFCAGHLQKLHLPDPGPDCFAFDSAGQGPYTGVADGRIFKYKGPKVGFVEYGYSKADR